MFIWINMWILLIMHMYMNTYINFSIQQLSDTLQIRLSSRPFKWTQLNIVLAGICTTVEKMKSTSTWILWAPTFFWCRKLSCVFVWGFYCCSTFNFIRDVTHRNRQCHVQDSLKLARRCAASSIYKCVCVMPRWPSENERNVLKSANFSCSTDFRRPSCLAARS